MASLLKDKNRSTKKFNGCRTIQFVTAGGYRKSVRLGKISQRNAEAVKVKVEALIEATIAQTSWDNETAAWIEKLDPKLHDKMASLGLLPTRKGVARSTLAAFLDGYIGLQNVKESTTTVYGHTRRCLVEFFGDEKLLPDISPGDADDWRKWLKSNQGLAPNTVRRRCGIARQFFKYAVRKRFIAENPFAEIDGGVSVRANRERDYFVSHEEAAKVLDACPDAQWRLLFALSRYGGLRCPSEHLALRWGDVDWEHSRMTVRSPKTEHHEGKAYRVIPIFPELRPYLDEVYEQAAEGTEFVITRYRDHNSNLRTQLLRIIERAGIIPWPKLFQNLRSTRETELHERFPIQVVCEWIGNSLAVAAKHYLQITEEHFTKAANEPSEALQQPAVTGSKPLSEKNAPAVITENYGGLRYCTGVQVGDTGLEPVTPSLSS